MQIQNDRKQDQRGSERERGPSRRSEAEAGFTLVEMIVAVALFAIVMLVCVGALLALVNANRKAQALQSVMNNLNIALDGMVRSVRMGSTYHCGIGGAFAPLSPTDCGSGDSAFAFEPYGNLSSDPPWVYVFDRTGSYCGEARLCKSLDGGVNFIAISAPEVSIDDLQFYVVGTTAGDTTQPKVVIVIKGTAGLKQSNRTTFHIEATAVQRVLDL